jgi:glycosyltransferase involved in cell wall biosynthesis
MYPPTHNCGGEYFIHNMAKYLISKGHEVRVLMKDSKVYDIDQIYTFEGVTVFPCPDNDQTPLFYWADIVFTHLQWAAWTISICNTFKHKPCVFVSHNFWPYDIVKFRPNTRVIYNSNAMRGILNYENNNIVVHPPCDYRKWDFGGPSGNHITLINMNLNKGSRLFMALAKAMPERKFLAVRGSYDTQWIEPLPNLTILDNSPDMEPVYRYTRILLMPSAFESWGMTATEAMCNGIPVIYNSTPGLRENVGECGIELHNLNPDYEEKDLKGGEHPGIDPEANLQQWIKAIKRLDNHLVYKKYSNLSRKRSRELDPESELQNLENWLWTFLNQN